MDLWTSLFLIIVIHQHTVRKRRWLQTHANVRKWLKRANYWHEVSSHEQLKIVSKETALLRIKTYNKIINGFTIPNTFSISNYKFSQILIINRLGWVTAKGWHTKELLVERQMFELKHSHSYVERDFGGELHSSKTLLQHCFLHQTRSTFVW